MVPLYLFVDQKSGTSASILSRWRKLPVRDRPPGTCVDPRACSSVYLWQSQVLIECNHAALRLKELFPLCSHEEGRVCRDGDHAHCCRSARSIVPRLLVWEVSREKKGVFWQAVAVDDEAKSQTFHLLAHRLFCYLVCAEAAPLLQQAGLLASVASPPSLGPGDRSSSCVAFLSSSSECAQPAPF